MEDTAELGTQLWLSEWFIWPPAQFVNFYFLPTKYRVVYDNLVSLFYDWYTSHLKHSRAAVEELKGQDFMVLEDQILNLESESDHVESESMGLRQVLWQRLGPPPPPFGGRFSTRWFPPSPNCQTYQDAIWNNSTDIWRNIEIHSVIHISMIITGNLDPRSEKSYEMKEIIN